MQDEDSFAHHNLVPETGLGESTFYEANANRGLTQMLEVFDKLVKRASRRSGAVHAQLGDRVAIDGSLIDATLSMIWADYRDTKSLSENPSSMERDIGTSKMNHSKIIVSLLIPTTEQSAKAIPPTTCALYSPTSGPLASNSLLSHPIFPTHLPCW